MGKIRIEIRGSFKPNEVKEFSALQTGHADCIAQVIEYLSREALPRAIEQDHALQANGQYPARGFGKREQGIDYAELAKNGI